MANIWQPAESGHWLEWPITLMELLEDSSKATLLYHKKHPNTTWHNMLKPLHGQNLDKPCKKQLISSWYIRKHPISLWIVVLNFPKQWIKFCPSNKSHDEKTAYQRKNKQNIWETPLQTTIVNMNGRRQRFHSHIAVGSPTFPTDKSHHQ